MSPVSGTHWIYSQIIIYLLYQHFQKNIILNIFVTIHISSEMESLYFRGRRVSFLAIYR